MNWFFKWLRDGINNVDNHDRDEREAISKLGVGLAIPKVRHRGSQGIQTAGRVMNDGEVSLTQQPMHFRIYPATGGHIVEYTYYNDKTDRHDQALHLIPSELDLGSELSKIMTLEALKR